MVMIISVDQVLEETDFPENGLICETYSRNRRVRMLIENYQIIIFNFNDVVGNFQISQLDQAVETFNYYASRNLSSMAIVL